MPARGYQVVDVGVESGGPDVDYPPYSLHTASRVVADPGSLGIVAGGSGNSEQIAANKVPGVRAALAWNVETARLARQHNNANILGIGGRMHSIDDAATIVLALLETSFSGAERHSARITQIADYERIHRLRPLVVNAGINVGQLPRVKSG